MHNVEIATSPKVAIQVTRTEFLSEGYCVVLWYSVWYCILCTWDKPIPQDPRQKIVSIGKKK